MVRPAREGTEDRRVNGGEIVLVITAVGSVIGAIAVLVKGRGENRNKAAEVYSAAEEMVATRVKEDLSGAFSRIDTLEKKVDTLEARHRLDARQKAEMIRHIIALEGQFPNPPGPPARPDWHIETE
jgi:hypothetical protein